MRDLIRITIKSRDPLNPESLSIVGTIGVAALGDMEIILDRDAMGVIKLDSSSIATGKNDFGDVVTEAQLTLTELHVKMGEVTIAAQHALTDMFALKKWLERE